MRIIERKTVLDVILNGRSYCVGMTENNLRLAKAAEFLENEGVLCELVVNGTKENGYWFDSLKVSKDSCFILAKKHTDGHYYTESESIRNIEGFEVLPAGAVYELIIEDVTVKFAVARNFRGEFVESEWICQVNSLEYMTDHEETEYVYLNGKILEWDTQINTVNKNIAVADRLEAERRNRSGMFVDVKHDFGAVRNWD